MNWLHPRPTLFPYTTLFRSLETEMRALGEAAHVAGISIVGGDTKVVEHGKADGLYITTTGIGIVDSRARLSAAFVRSEEHTSELQSHVNLVCRPLLEKKQQA